MDDIKKTMSTVALWSTASLVGASVIYGIAHLIANRS
jgi:hypothetical protein